MNLVIQLNDAYNSVLCVQLQAIVFRHHLYRIFFNDMDEAANWRPRFENILSKKSHFASTEVSFIHKNVWVRIEGLLCEGENSAVQFVLHYQLKRWNAPLYNQWPSAQLWTDCYLWERPFLQLIRIMSQRRLNRRLTLALCWTKSDGWLSKMPVELLEKFV
jgi:hypothetical protein